MLTTAKIQKLIQNMNPGQISWQDLMDREWFRYPVSQQEWEAEQTALSMVRTAMPRYSHLWERFKQAYGTAYHMKYGPTYDSATKLLSRIFSVFFPGGGPEPPSSELIRALEKMVDVVTEVQTAG